MGPAVARARRSLRRRDEHGRPVHDGRPGRHGPDSPQLLRPDGNRPCDLRVRRRSGEPPQLRPRRRRAARVRLQRDAAGRRSAPRRPHRRLRRLRPAEARLRQRTLCGRPGDPGPRRRRRGPAGPAVAPGPLGHPRQPAAHPDDRNRHRLAHERGGPRLPQPDAEGRSDDDAGPRPLAGRGRRQPAAGVAGLGRRQVQLGASLRAPVREAAHRLAPRGHRAARAAAAPGGHPRARAEDLPHAQGRPHARPAPHRGRDRRRLAEAQPARAGRRRPHRSRPPLPPRPHRPPVRPARDNLRIPRDGPVQHHPRHGDDRRLRARVVRPAGARSARVPRCRRRPQPVRLPHLHALLLREARHARGHGPEPALARQRGGAHRPGLRRASRPARRERLPRGGRGARARLPDRGDGRLPPGDQRLRRPDRHAPHQRPHARPARHVRRRRPRAPAVADARAVPRHPLRAHGRARARPRLERLAARPRRAPRPRARAQGGRGDAREAQGHRADAPRDGAARLRRPEPDGRGDGDPRGGGGAARGGRGRGPAPGHRAQDDQLLPRRAPELHLGPAQPGARAERRRGGRPHHPPPAPGRGATAASLRRSKADDPRQRLPQHPLHRPRARRQRRAPRPRDDPGGRGRPRGRPPPLLRRGRRPRLRPRRAPRHGAGAFRAPGRGARVDVDIPLPEEN